MLPVNKETKMTITNEELRHYLIKNIMPEISPNEFKILLSVAQETFFDFGYSLPKIISLNDFMNNCGISSHNTVLKNLFNLIKLKYVKRKGVRSYIGGVTIYAYELHNSILNVNYRNKLFSYRKNIDNIILQFVYGLGFNSCDKNGYTTHGHHLIKFGMYSQRGFIYVYIKDSNEIFCVQESVYNILPDDKTEEYIKMFNVFDNRINFYFKNTSRIHFPSICKNCGNFFWSNNGLELCHNCQKPESGYVYLIHAVGSNRYKIGKSKNPQERLERLKSSTIGPFELKIITKIKSDNYSELEIKLHNLFIDKRIRGEWFELDLSDVNYVKSLT